MASALFVPRSPTAQACRGRFPASKASPSTRTRSGRGSGRLERYRTSGPASWLPIPPQPMRTTRSAIVGALRRERWVHRHQPVAEAKTERGRHLPGAIEGILELAPARLADLVRGLEPTGEVLRDRRLALRPPRRRRQLHLSEPVAGW